MAGHRVQQSQVSSLAALMQGSPMDTAELLQDEASRRQLPPVAKTTLTGKDFPLVHPKGLARPPARPGLPSTAPASDELILAGT